MVGTGLAAEAVDLRRTAGLSAIRVVPPSAERTLVRVSRRIPPRPALLRVRHFPPEGTTGASTILASEFASGLMASERIATTTAMDVEALTDIQGDTRASTILIGGRILVRRSTMTSNTRPAWPTR